MIEDNTDYHPDLSMRLTNKYMRFMSLPLMEDGEPEFVAWKLKNNLLRVDIHTCSVEVWNRWICAKASLKPTLHIILWFPIR